MPNVNLECSTGNAQIDAHGTAKTAIQVLVFCSLTPEAGRYLQVALSDED